MSEDLLTDFLQSHNAPACTNHAYQSLCSWGYYCCTFRYMVCDSYHVYVSGFSRIAMNPSYCIYVRTGVSKTNYTPRPLGICR